MTFSFVVMRGSFVSNARGEVVDLCQMAHKRLNSRITAKHFTDDLLHIRIMTAEEDWCIDGSLSLLFFVNKTVMHPSLK